VVARLICEVCGSYEGTAHRFNCPGFRPDAKPRLRRVEAGRYRTADEMFEVWQANQGLRSYEQRWYVNSTRADIDETLATGGFERKWQAVQWIEKLYSERPAWLFDGK
jgi:hypothetical protein